MPDPGFDVAVDPGVHATHPDYVALALVASGIANGPSDADSDAHLAAAEAHLRGAGLGRATDHPHIAAWRAAFSGFGAKPSRYPSSSGDGTEVEPVGAGEIVWRDDRGVPCRRWNWRQGRRTQPTIATTRAFFVLDRLDGLTVDGLHAAAGELSTLLLERWSDCHLERVERCRT